MLYGIMSLITCCKIVRREHYCGPRYVCQEFGTTNRRPANA